MTSTTLLLCIYVAFGCVAAVFAFVRCLLESRERWDLEEWAALVLVCLFIGVLWPLAFSAWLCDAETR